MVISIFSFKCELVINFEFECSGLQKVTLTFNVQLWCKWLSSRGEKDKFRGFWVLILRPIETEQFDFQNVPDFP